MSTSTPPITNVETANGERERWRSHFGALKPASAVQISHLRALRAPMLRERSGTLASALAPPPPKNPCPSVFIRGSFTSRAFAFRFPPQLTPTPNFLTLCGCPFRPAQPWGGGHRYYRGDACFRFTKLPNPRRA